MTKAMFEHLDELVASHVSAKQISRRERGQRPSRAPSSRRGRLLPRSRRAGVTSADLTDGNRRCLTSRSKNTAAPVSSPARGRLAMMTAAIGVLDRSSCIVAAYSPLSSTVTRSLHVAFLLLLTYLVVPANRRRAVARRHPVVRRLARRSPRSGSASTTGSSKPH